MNLTISLQPEQINRVLTALGELKYNEAAPLIGEIMRQANDQIEAARTAQEQPVAQIPTVPDDAAEDAA